MTTIATRLQQVHARLDAACQAAQRDPASVTLLAVSKTCPAEAVAEAAAAGQTRFGENYVQEGLEKIEALAELRGRLEWHLIGPLQSNKTGAVAEAFDWVHSVDRRKMAEGLAAQRAPHARLCALAESLRRDGLSLDTLSMGMSADLEAAVLEGATMDAVAAPIGGTGRNGRAGCRERVAL